MINCDYNTRNIKKKSKLKSFKNLERIVDDYLVITVYYIKRIGTKCCYIMETQM